MSKEMKKIYFSVIVPIYNTEQYIEECVNSIINQKYNQLEILLINDGSSDNSLQVCEKLAKKYANIKVINQEHKGLSAGRNNGIKNASGEYLLFLDSDDYIEKDFLFDFSDYILKNNNPDIVFLEAVKKFPNGDEAVLDPMLSNLKACSSPQDFLDVLATMSKFPASTCTKAWNKNFLINHEHFFDETIMTSEDIDFMLRAIMNSPIVGYYDKKYYYYRQNRMGSITNKLNAEKINSMFSIIDNFSSKKDLKNKENIYAILSYQYSIILAQIFFLTKEEKKELKYNYKDYKWLLNFGKSRKTRVINLIRKIVGITMTGKILNSYLRIRNIIHK